MQRLSQGIISTHFEASRIDFTSGLPPETIMMENSRDGNIDRETAINIAGSEHGANQSLRWTRKSLAMVMRRFCSEVVKPQTRSYIFCFLLEDVLLSEEGLTELRETTLNAIAPSLCSFHLCMFLPYSARRQQQHACSGRNLGRS